MPESSQGTIEFLGSTSEQDGTYGSSNKSSLKRAFPAAIHHQIAPLTKLREKPADPGVDVELTPENYREAYADEVMSGVRNIPGSDFANTDMDYGTNPGTDSDKVPERAIFNPDLPLGHDNTIAPGGLGPNVATLDIESVENPGAGAPMVEAKSPTGAPFVSPNNTLPYASSKKISEGNIFGGTDPNGGNFGVSNAEA